NLLHASAIRFGGGEALAAYRILFNLSPLMNMYLTGDRLKPSESAVVFKADALFFEESLEDARKQDAVVEDILPSKLADPLESLQDLAVD
ncbi:hypothetical protein HDU98_004940, partial [Podochytrium sp. JEL0797]